jgi:ATP-dependent helicase/nuclease subunit A
VVGDSRQSIYRFRGADVTVFRDVRVKTELEGGLVSELSESHRTQPALRKTTHAILGAIMGTQEDPTKPFHVPFTKMVAMRDEVPSGLRRPYLEVLIGAGSDSEEGRMLAANLLAERLIVYKQAGEIQDWKDVALLFRASGAFPVYEQAFEAAGIPYVTIAGSGFYDRPEIRDILNLLRTLADPWDDLAMIGFLRSPAVGMSDQGITQLRWSSSIQEPISLRQALEKDFSFLSSVDQQAAEFAIALFTEFERLAGSIPVAALLQRLIERTHYRVILAGTVDRGWRNIEKLLMDAYDSHQTSIHAYLEYVQKIRTSGVREGEAAGAAEDALQLMTIHKSKGLEFPWVILEDAGRKATTNKDRWLVMGDWLAIHSDREDYSSLLSRYLKIQEGEKEEAETRRLLYVALTRAKDKLIVSGHFSQTKEKYTVNGWLKEILNLLELDPNLLVENPPIEPLPFPGEELLGIQLRKEMVAFPAAAIEAVEEQFISMRNFLSDLQIDVAGYTEEEEEQINLDLFETSDKFPLWVGKLLHQAIQHWEFRNTEALMQFLERSALKLGILDVEQRKRAIQRAKLYMQRLQEHPIYEEISRATRRYHEVPYELRDEPQNDRGRLDILYLTEGGWKIVDFKTDHLNSLSDLQEDRRTGYRAQLLRYQHSVFQQLSEKPLTQLCFLNCGNGIEVVNVEDF